MESQIGVVGEDSTVGCCDVAEAVVTRSCAIRSGGEVLFVNDDERT